MRRLSICFGFPVVLGRERVRAIDIFLVDVILGGRWRTGLIIGDGKGIPLGIPSRRTWLRCSVGISYVGIRKIYVLR